MRRGIFCFLLIVSFVLGLNPSMASYDVNANFILTPFNSSISPRVDAFYAGRDKSTKPSKLVKLEGDVDEDSSEDIVLEEDVDAEKKYSFLISNIVSSAVSDLFNTEFPKGRRRLAVSLRSVDSIVGSFSDSIVEALKAKGLKLKTKSIGSVESIENVTLKFKTARVAAVRTARKPNEVTVRGDLVRVEGEEGLGAKRNLARGRFVIKFVQEDSTDDEDDV